MGFEKLQAKIKPILKEKELCAVAFLEKHESNRGVINAHSTINRIIKKYFEILRRRKEGLEMLLQLRGSDMQYVWLEKRFPNPFCL